MPPGCTSTFTRQWIALCSIEARAIVSAVFAPLSWRTSWKRESNFLSYPFPVMFLRLDEKFSLRTYCFKRSKISATLSWDDFPNRESFLCNFSSSTNTKIGRSTSIYNTNWNSISRIFFKTSACKSIARYLNTPFFPLSEYFGETDHSIIPVSKNSRL